MKRGKELEMCVLCCLKLNHRRREKAISRPCLLGSLKYNADRVVVDTYDRAVACALFEAQGAVLPICTVHFETQLLYTFMTSKQQLDLVNIPQIMLPLKFRRQ